MARPDADADQDAALEAVREQGQLCLEHLHALAPANLRILEAARDGDPLWGRVANMRYNQVCSDRAQDPGSSDPFVAAIQASADLKLVCDNRWILGEAVDVLRARLQRLDTIAAPYDDFERCIRSSITGPDRSPVELDQGIERALTLGARAAAWVPKRKEEGTLAERWKRKLQNNPLIAAASIAVAVLTGLAGAYAALPEELRERIGLAARPAAPGEGWAMAGRLDPGDPRKWSRAQVDVVDPSAATGRILPLRTGDIVEPRVPLKVWVVGYKTHGMAKLLTAPGLSTLGAPEANQTGASYVPHMRYEVLGASRLPVPGEDDILWARLGPQ